MSPTRSVLEGMVEGLRRIERRDLETLTDALGGWFGSGFSGGFPGAGGGDRVVEYDPGYFGDGQTPDQQAPAARFDDGAELVEPEPVLGGYTYEGFRKLPPEEQARVLAELQEQRQPGQSRIAGRP